MKLKKSDYGTRPMGETWQKFWAKFGKNVFLVLLSNQTGLWRYTLHGVETVEVSKPFDSKEEAYMAALQSARDAVYKAYTEIIYEIDELSKTM